MSAIVYLRSCFMLTTSGENRLWLAIADGFFSRLRGLMLAPPLEPGQGLLLTRCTSVHTCFMRQVVDVIYLDRNGIVTKCVSALKPWRASSSQRTDGGGKRYPSAMHVLELAAGSIARFEIAEGCRLQVAAILRPLEQSVPSTQVVRAKALKAKRQRGSAIIEFIVVGPIITLLGLASIQYGLLFFAKNQYNHAAFMAARAGTTGNPSRSGA